MRAVGDGLAQTAKLVQALGERMQAGSAAVVLAQASHFMQLASIVVVSWELLRMATSAKRGLVSKPDDAFYEAKLATARYFIDTELTRVPQLAALCLDAAPAFVTLDSAAFD